MPIHDYDGNSNFTLSVTILKIFIVEICMTFSWPLGWARSNVITHFKSPYMTCYFMAIAILPYVSSFPRYSLSKCAWHWHRPLDWALSNVYILVESPCMTFHSLSIVTCTISVIVCKIIIYELSTCCQFQLLTLK